MRAPFKCASKAFSRYFWVNVAHFPDGCSTFTKIVFRSYSFLRYVEQSKTFSGVEELIEALTNNTSDASDSEEESPAAQKTLPLKHQGIDFVYRTRLIVPARQRFALVFTRISCNRSGSA